MLYHLHIEKSGGKTIETNLGLAIGKRCLRLTTVDGYSKVSKQPAKDKLAKAVRDVDAAVLTGHFAFGLHQLLEDKSPRYISLVRSPLSRAKSYFNYILNSHMYDLKDLLLKNRWAFEDFALGAYDDLGVPGEIALVRSNGQSRAIGNALASDLSQGELFARAVAAIESVDYALFPTEKSVEAYYWVLHQLKVNPLRRYVLSNIAPYDHVGPVDPGVRAQFEAANEADQNLYELAKERASATLNGHRGLLIQASLARKSVRVEQQLRTILGPNVLAAISESLRPRPQDVGRKEAEIDVELPHGARQISVVSGDIKGELYARKNNWDDIPHRLWRAAVRRSDRVVDLGSNYGEFLLVAEQDIGSGCRVTSVEANPRVAACQVRTLGRTSLGDRVEVLNRAASSQSGIDVTFHVRSVDSGSSSILPTRQSEKIVVSTVCVDDIIGGFAAATLSIKIDIEGHDVQALKGGLRAIDNAAAAFVTLELNAKQWPEFLDIVSKSKKLSQSPVYVYIWNSLFKIDRNFRIPSSYTGNFDVYITSSTELVRDLDLYATEFYAGRVA